MSTLLISFYAQVNINIPPVKSDRIHLKILPQKNSTPKIDHHLKLMTFIQKITSWNITQKKHHIRETIPGPFLNQVLPGDAPTDVPEL